MTRTLFALLLMILAANTCLSQEAKPPASQPSAAELLKLTGPGPEHERLEKFAGDWDVEVRMGGAKPLSGTATARMTVGGRFLAIEYTAKQADQSLEGLLTLGFDRRHGRHVIVAQDSYGTYFVTAQEKTPEDPAEKSGKIKLFGQDDDPVMKARGFTKEFAFAIDITSADTLTVEVLFIDTRTPARRELSAMTYTFRRKK